ncbi:MAG TPA: ATP-dependent sacrificial sulfur transferase LarE [Methanomicrobiales archaeon]|nr:ATP-dependent sacrificial sulfur transferase LarE [Methanomicrobiales archaeon]
MTGNTAGGAGTGLDEKERQLKDQIAARGPMLIAFSGGVDSSLLAAVAREVLGDRCHAVLLESPLIPPAEIREARETAAGLGIPLEVLPLPALEEETIRRNPPDRCYHCRMLTARILKGRARELGLAAVADGTSASDLGEHRPGLRAATEEGILHPFVEAGLTKEDIRAIALRRGHGFWNRPSAACLASRIPYGDELGIAKLRMVGDAEELLHALGFGQVRVRLHGELARIEVMPGEMERLWRERERVLESLTEMGFTYVTVDLAGYRSGSMDEVL